jgi:peptidyl-prolyl cis-trans isomerase D
MLTDLREKSQSFLIYILFGILIVVFIFFFGPQSEGCQPNAVRVRNLSAWAAKVNGEAITQREVEISVRRQALLNRNFDDSKMAELRRTTVDQVVEQTVVEQKARSMGLAIGDKSLSQYILSDDNPDYPLFLDRDGKFSSKSYRDQLTQLLGATTDSYRRAKEREVLVSRYLTFLMTQVKVSDPEVRAAYDRANRTWNLEYVVFDPAAESAGENPTAEAVAEFTSKNAEGVKAYYGANTKRFNRAKEVRVRRVLVKKPKDGGDEATAEAKKKAEALLADAQKPDADFGALAAEKSEGYYKKSRGDMGWQTAETTSKGDFAVYEKLTKGQVSSLQESAIGFWFVKADDVKPAISKTLEKATSEIATTMLTDQIKTEAARKLAEDLLSRARSGKTLTELTLPPTPIAPVTEGETDAPPKPPESPVRTTGPFSEDRPVWARIPGIGQSEEIAAKLGALTPKKPLIEGALEVEKKLYVVRLRERVEPTDEGFAAEKDDFALRLRIGRTNRLFGNWRGILFGAVSQRELLRKFQGGSMLSGNLGAGIEVNEADYPLESAPASQPTN